MSETRGSGLGSTPAQTVGPFLHIALDWADGPTVVDSSTPGAVVIAGRLLDGAGEPVADGLVEIWGADPDGRFDHPDDPRGPGTGYPGFRGFGRCATGADGTFWFRTLKPGPLPAGGTGSVDGELEAPHLDVSVFARGLLDRLVTRIYFPDEAAANAADPVLRGLDEHDRALLTAVPQIDGSLRFDIRLRGDGQTPFFAV